MRKIDKMAVLTLSALVIGACASQTKGAASATSESQVSKVSKVEVTSGSSSSKTLASSQTSEGSSTEAVASVPTEAGTTVVHAEERTEPNPPLPPDIADKLMRGEIGEGAKQANIGQGIRKRLAITPQLQEVWYYCAPTTVSMMLASRGLSVSQHQLAREMGTYEPYGTHNRDAIRILNKHLFGYEFPEDGQAGYRLATVTDASSNSEDMRLFKERVRKNIDDGYPMYYTFNVEQIYPGKKGEHNVIGIGYELTPDGKDISALYYLDPDTHVQDPVYGGLKKVSPEELLSATVTCGEPNYAW